MTTKTRKTKPNESNAWSSQETHRVYDTAPGKRTGQGLR